LRFSGSSGQRFPPELIAQTEALQERRRLRILHRRVRCSGIGHGRDLCILLLPDPCPMISLGLDLCPCILHGPGSSVLFRGPNLRCLLHHPYRSRLCGSGLCSCLFLGRPSLELLEQFFGEGLADLGLTRTGLARAGLTRTGLALTDLDSALIGRFNSRSNFVARRRVRCRRRQILRAGDCLDCWCRRIGFRLSRRFVDPPIRHVRNERNRISDR